MAEFFNKNVKYLRTIKGLSQQALADKVGVDRTTISRIENGEIETTIDNAINIADVLNIDFQDMICKDLSKYDNSRSKNELDVLFDKHKDILTDSDKTIIKTIIEQRKKEIDKELDGENEWKKNIYLIH